MINFSKLSLAVILGAALVVSSSSVFAQILGSKHDMSSTGTGQVASSATDEICVYCHTPHGSDITAPAPLWNRFLNTSVTYQRYSTLGTATLDGDEAPVGSVSLACLSCHDGQQAMDAVINAPGSGGYNAAGAVIGGGAGTTMTGTPIPMLGTDMRDDHPISIQYAGGACQGTSADCDPSTAASGDPDFNTAQYASINSSPQWWVDTGTSGANVREKTDMILYARSDYNTATGTGPAVECGSCHDPHNASTFSSTAPLSVAFLRLPNTGSQVCLACHIK